jgi:uncharacterized membrane protein YdbT with pleckstrin-like domain
MDYVRSVLQPGETLSVIGRRHWIIYKKAIGALVLAIVVFALARSRPDQSHFIPWVLDMLALVLFVLAILLAAHAWFDQWNTEIAVTNRRVIYKEGFIKRYTAEMNMDKIESVVVTQSILGRLLGYGSIEVRGTGEGFEDLHQIADPIGLRNHIVVG